MPQLKISFPTLLFFASYLLFDRSIYTLLPLLAALTHELGHFVVILLCRRHIECIRFYPLGIDIRCAPTVSSYRSDLAVCLAGVLANLVAILLCLPHSEHPTATVFLSANAVLLAVNLLPIDTLDGGCAIAAALSLWIPPERVYPILRKISFFGILFLWLVACDLLLLTGYNFSLFFMTVYLFFSLFLPPWKSKDSKE